MILKLIIKGTYPEMYPITFYTLKLKSKYLIVDNNKLLRFSIYIVYIDRFRKKFASDYEIKKYVVIVFKYQKLVVVRSINDHDDDNILDTEC